MNRQLLSLACVLCLFAACKSSSDGDPANAADAASDGGDTSGNGATSGKSGAAGKSGDAAGGSTSGSSGDDGGNAGAAETEGGAPVSGGTSSGMAGKSSGAAGEESVAGSSTTDNAPACEIPDTLVGSCAKKDLQGNIKSCAVYWGSAFTADALKAACPSPPTLGANICPSEGSVGVCEASSGPTALATYYYNAADGTPANQAQCNANTGHVWCSP